MNMSDSERDRSAVPLRISPDREHLIHCSDIGKETHDTHSFSQPRQPPHKSCSSSSLHLTFLSSFHSMLSVCRGRLLLYLSSNIVVSVRNPTTVSRACRYNKVTHHPYLLHLPNLTRCPPPQTSSTMWSHLLSLMLFIDALASMMMKRGRHLSILEQTEDSSTIKAIRNTRILRFGADCRIAMKMIRGDPGTDRTGPARGDVD
jgi:hypothetical protein